MRRVLVATAAISAAVAWDRRARRRLVEHTADPAAMDHADAPATADAVGPTRAPSRFVVAVLAVAIASVLVGGVTAVPTVSAHSPGSGTGTVSRPAPGLTAAGEPAPVPVQIDIPHIGVSAPVDELGLLDDRTIAVPEQVERTGWYAGLETPGEPGTAVIVGHLDSQTGPGVFAKLPELQGGEEIAVTRADGSTVTFVVDRIEQYDKDEFPTIAVYSPTAEPSLRLITCGGGFDRRSGHYRENVVVYAYSQEAT